MHWSKLHAGLFTVPSLNPLIQSMYLLITEVRSTQRLLAGTKVLARSFNKRFRTGKARFGKSRWSAVI